ncbi:MAG: prevent-host-death protein [Bacilli bacterium]|nr:prevent-host-death protein [Bacilli bacterium]
MATILPVSDLRNYNKVLDNVTEDDPVYLTVNGRGKYIIHDIKVEEEYEKMKAMITLLLHLREGKQSGEKEGYLSSEDVRNHFDKKEV